MSNKNLYALLCVFMTLVVVGLFAYGPINTLKQNVKKLRTNIAELQADLAYCDAEIQRDDDIFMAIFGDQWRRSQPAYRLQVRVSAYSSRVRETDNSPHVTSSETFVRRGIVAISEDLRDLGLKDGDAVFLNGYGILYVEDTMHPRKQRQVDVWIADTEAAYLHGVNPAVTMMWFGKGGNDEPN